MKEIKIRFIQRKKENDYLIQRKTFFGWKYITHTVDVYTGSIVYFYSKETKENLLDQVLEKYYKTDKRFVTIIEYPTIIHH